MSGNRFDEDQNLVRQDQTGQTDVSANETPKNGRKKLIAICSICAAFVVVVAAVLLAVFFPRNGGTLQPVEPPEQQPAHVHTWDEGTVMAPSTCTTNGTIQYMCVECDATKTEKLPLEPHVAMGDYEYNGADHWHICVNCGGVYDLGTHTLSPTGEIITLAATENSDKAEQAESWVCEFCGATGAKVLTAEKEELRFSSWEIASLTTVGNGYYLFIPRLDGSNFSVKNSGNQPISIKYVKSNTMGYAPIMSVPVGAGTISVLPDSIRDKDELIRLLGRGYTEIRMKVNLTLTGGKWWGGPVTIGAPWCNTTWDATTNPDGVGGTPDDSTTGDVLVRFSLQKVIDNYDTIMKSGLFSVTLANWASDAYTIAFSAAEITVDHEWGEDWSKDETRHYHECSICGARKDEARHTMEDAFNCSVCGQVPHYLFTPDPDKDNVIIVPNNDVEVKDDNRKDALVSKQIATGSGGAVMKVTGLDKTKAELEKLLEAGYTEVECTIRTRVNGGQFWGGGTVTITAPWSHGSFSDMDHWDNANGALITGPQTVKFALADLVANYDIALEKGLFQFAYNNQADNQWVIDLLTPVTVAVDHEYGDDWDSDETYHFHECSVCGQVYGKAKHKMVDNFTCSVCGTVHRYVFTAEADGSNTEAITSSGKEAAVDHRQSSLVCWKIPVSSGSAAIHVTALDKTKEELQELVDLGYTEVVGTIQTRVTGGKFWAGAITVSAPWCSIYYTANDVWNNAEGSLTAGPIDLKFSLKEMIAHYDEILEKGLFSVSYNQQNDNEWAIDLRSPFEAAVAHEFSDEWDQDETYHFHRCSVCGKIESREKHDMESNFSCSVCGTVHRYVWEPTEESAEFVSSTGLEVQDAPHRVDSLLNKRFDLNAGSVTIKATALDKTKEEIQQLLDMGYTEVVATVRTRVWGGKWWDGGTITVSAPWSTGTYSVLDQNIPAIGGLTSDAIKVKFSLRDLLNNYDTALEKGMLVIAYNQQNSNAWDIDVMTAFEAAIDHNWAEGWSKDDDTHYHLCTACGMKTDVEPHNMADMFTCTVCGRVPHYIFTPNSSNTVFSNAANNPMEEDPRAEALLTQTIPIQSGAVTIKATALDKTKEELQQLLNKGYTEVVATVRSRVNGGMYYGGGTVTFSAPWASNTIAAPDLTTLPEISSVTTGPVTIRFGLQELVDNYEKVLSEGLLQVTYNQPNNQYSIDFLSPFEATIDHDYGEWQQDEDRHWHQCAACGKITDEAEHEMADLFTCSVCGPVHHYLYTPLSDGSNLEFAANIPARTGSTWNDCIIARTFDPGAGTVTLNVTALDKTKEQLQALLDEGYTEVTGTVRGRITGGSWYGGDFTVSAPWCSQSFTVVSDSQNVMGPIDLKFNLKELVENYDKVSSEGFLTFTFSAQANDEWSIDLLSPFQVTVDHDFGDTGWQQDADNHWKQCLACGYITDKAPHEMEDLFTCSACGVVHHYVYTPSDEGTHFSNSGNKPMDKDPRREALTTAEFPAGSGTVTVKADALELTKEQLQALLEKGFTEVTVTVRTRVTGGKWWDGAATFTAPWSSQPGVTVSDQTDPAVSNLTSGSVVLKYSLKELIEKYDQVLSDGLLKVTYNQQNDNQWCVDFLSPYEVTVAHEEDAWTQSETHHWHECTVCGEIAGEPEEHEWEDPFHCAVCGEVHRYVFTPLADGSNLEFQANNGTAAAARADTIICRQFTERAGNVTLKVTALDKTKEELETLQKQGFNEVKATVRTRITGGKWWGGAITVTAPWSSDKFTASDVSNVARPLTVTFKLSDLIANYEKAISDGLLVISYNQQGDNQWALDIMSAFEVVGSLPTFTDAVICNTDPAVVVGDPYSIGVKNTEGRTVHYSTNNSDWQDDLPTFVLPGEYTVYWKVDALGELEEMSGSNKVTIKYYLNTMADVNSWKATYTVGSDEKTSAGASQFAGTVGQDSRTYQAWIAAWAKAKTPQIFMTPTISKEGLQKLVDAGATQFTVTVKQSYMNDDPWWGLSSQVTADWTSQSYTVSDSEGKKVLTYNLQELLDHYDEIAGGTMSFLKVYCTTFAEGDGGYWNGGTSSWTSSSYSFNVYDCLIS